MNTLKLWLKSLPAIFLLPGSALLAADFKIPTITKAFDLFEPYPDKIAQGTLVAFKLKNSKAAPHVFEDGVQARIFALNDYDKVPRPIESKDDCDIYISYVFPLRAANNTDFVLKTVDEGWLYPTASQQGIKNGRYYIVFEKSGPKQQYFGIRPSDTDAYFESGFLLVVEDNGKASLEKVIKEFEERKAKLSEIRLKLDSSLDKIPCYKYTRYVITTEPKEQAADLLAMCESDTPGN